MIKFTQKVADDTSAAFSFYDFQTYVDKHSAAMLADGVRWSLRPDTKAVFDKNELNAVIADDQTTFARDLEPEYLALSEDGKTVGCSSGGQRDRHLRLEHQPVHQDQSSETQVS